MQEEPAATAPPASTVGEPEKVSVLDPKIAKAHTTFYHWLNTVYEIIIFKSLQ